MLSGAHAEFCVFIVMLSVVTFECRYAECRGALNLPPAADDDEEDERRRDGRRDSNSDDATFVAVQRHLVRYRSPRLTIVVCITLGYFN